MQENQAFTSGFPVFMYLFFQSPGNDSMFVFSVTDPVFKAKKNRHENENIYENLPCDDIGGHVNDAFRTRQKEIDNV